MAAGIAQLCVQSGLEAVLVFDSEEALGWAEDAVLRGLHRAEQPAAFSLLRKSTVVSRLAACDAVIEACSEEAEVKRDWLRRVDARLRPDRVLAVQTSALPVGAVASAVENPERVVGVRFFPPVPLVPAVEVIRGDHTSEEAMRDAMELAERLGKSPVRCKDAPGFAAGRVSRPFYLAALRLLEEGKGTPAAVDAALRNHAGFPAGPFERLDHGGLEEEHAASVLIHSLLGSPERLKPSGLLEKLLARGCRGRRNSRGFYVYGENPPGTVNPLLSELVAGFGSRPCPPGEIVAAVLDAAAEEARVAVSEGVASPQDIDTVMRKGLGWPVGPFEWMEKRGRRE